MVFQKHQESQNVNSSFIFQLIKQLSPRFMGSLTRMEIRPCCQKWQFLPPLFRTCLPFMFKGLCPMGMQQAGMHHACPSSSCPVGCGWHLENACPCCGEMSFVSVLLQEEWDVECPSFWKWTGMWELHCVSSRPLIALFLTWLHPDHCSSFLWCLSPPSTNPSPMSDSHLKYWQAFNFLISKVDL